MISRRQIRCAFFLLIFLLSGWIIVSAGFADERILDYISEITVHPAASLTVQETIRVRSEGKKIQHGIYRDFPTSYKTRAGLRRRVGFDLRQILRDGRPEPYHLKSRSNGVRIYMGDKDSLLPPGVHTYRITYTTDRQIGFFDDFDELYWNVTGNGWEFPIDRVSATVTLPAGATGRIRTMDGYTGLFGSEGKDFAVSIDRSGAIRYRTTRGLGPEEGLTLVAAWPKGYLEEPAGAREKIDFILDNKGIALGVGGLMVLITFYLIVWVRVGKDPSPGTIIPLYQPPKDLSPAALRYIQRMGFDAKTLAVSIIDLAVKGRLKIRNNEGEFSLTRPEDRGLVLRGEEKKVINSLFGSSDEIALKRKNYRKIQSALSGLKAYLRLKYEKKYFVTNRRYFVAGMIGSILICILSIMISGHFGALFFGIWITGWSFGVVMLIKQAIDSWRVYFGSSGWRRALVVGPLILSFMALIFLAVEIFVIYGLLTNFPSWILVIIFLLVAVNCLFYHLLKVPTRAGRRLLDGVEGFEMFLSIAEKDRLNLLNPPDQTPEIFERYLPYALALDVEQEWAEQFAGILARAGQGETEYHPSWYSGSLIRIAGTGGIVSSLSGSLAGAISSSSRSPGSSSGSSGGSSGGGGGGGGGGGW
jgi:uncharacterized membrane protein YgcG